MASDGKDLPDVSALAAGNDTDAPRPRVWVASDDGAPVGFGRVMVSFEAATATGDAPAQQPFIFALAARILGVLSPSSPRIAGNIALNSKTAANDNAVWVSLDDDGGDGALGCDVDVTTLANGTTVVAWIGDDGRAHAKAYAPADASDGVAAETAELNTVLADLGQAGTGQPGSGRLRLSNAGNGLAAVWVADFGLTAALIGKSFLLTQGEPGAESGTPQARWSVQEFADVSLPHDAAGLTVAAKGDGGYSVTYHTGTSASGTPGSETADVDAAASPGDTGTIELAALETGLTPADANMAGEEQHTAPHHAQIGSSTAPVERALQDDTADPVSPAASPDALVPDEGTPGGAAPALEPGFGSLGGGIAANAPQTVTLAGGGTATLSQQPGSQPGTTTLILTPLDANGQPLTGPDGAPMVTVVTEEAITSDPDNPHLDLAPAFAAADGGTAVVWAQESHKDGGKVVEVKVQLYDDACEPRSDAPATVAVAAYPGTLSDFAVAHFRGDHDHHDEHGQDGAAGAPSAAVALLEPEAPADAAPEAQPAAGESDGGAVSAVVAVLWVQDADEGGYGQIMGQRFGLEPTPTEPTPTEPAHTEPADTENYGAGAHLVAMGADGTAGDGHDGAFAVHDTDAGGEANAVGRGLVLAQAGQDELVVGWVEETSPGSGVEIVDGVVLSASGGTSLLAFDLTALMPNGILRGTDPSIRATNNGDIVIGWMQEVREHHYEVAAAVYKLLQPGQWVVPTEAVVLSSFEKNPGDVVIVVSDGVDPSITVSWKDGGSVLNETFSLDGDLISDSSHRGNLADVDAAANSDTLSVATSGGDVIVVFSEANGSGTSLDAVLVSLTETNGSQPGAGDANSSSGSSAAVAAVFMPADGQTATSGIEIATLTAEASAPVLISDAGSSGEDIATAYAIADAEDDLIRFIDTSSSGSGHGEGARAGENSSGSGDSGGRTAAGEDSFHFVSGYGNEIEDYDDEDDLYDDAMPEDPMLAAFDALQFANALSEAGNMEVITFDASNVVHIRDFTAL